VLLQHRRENISGLFGGNDGGRLEFCGMNILEHDVVVNYWMFSYATDEGKNKSIQNFVK
jgi:hypothetical protein